MLSSGRGLGGVVVRGIEPDNPVITSQWSRYMTQGSLADLLKAYNPATPGQPPPQGAIAIGVTLAQKLKVKRGDAIRVIAPIVGASGNLTARSANFVVGAIFDSGMAFLDANIVFMDLMRAQNFFGRPGVVDGIDVHLTILDATDQVANTLRRSCPSQFRVRSWVQYNQSASAGFAMLKRVYAMVLMLLIGVAAFNLIATLIMVVMEKRKDVAVLMAMGATPSEIRRVFTLKGLIVGGAGTLAGLMLGAIGCERARALSLHPHLARGLWDIVGADRGRSDKFRMGRDRLDGAVPARDDLSSAASLARTAGGNFPDLIFSARKPLALRSRSSALSYPPCRRPPISNKLRSSTIRSADFPAASEPVTLSIPIARAGLSV